MSHMLYTVTFWQDWQTNGRDERLLYKIFQNN